jgi:hypothetical protein
VNDTNKGTRLSRGSGVSRTAGGHGSWPRAQSSGWGLIPDKDRPRIYRLEHQADGQPLPSINSFSPADGSVRLAGLADEGSNAVLPCEACHG